MTKENTDKVTTLALVWLEANQAKNTATTLERKTAEKLKKEVVNGTKVIEINDKLDIHVGFMDSESEEIDPKELFKRNPDMFWQLCSIPKTALIALVGDKEAAKMMRTVNKNDFKVKKVKKD